MCIHILKDSRLAHANVLLEVFKEQINTDEAKDDPGAGNLHFIQFDFEGPFSATLSYRNEGGLHISRGFTLHL